MLNSVFLTPELGANLVDYKKTQDLLGDVLIELIRQERGTSNFSPVLIKPKLNPDPDPEIFGAEAEPEPEPEAEAITLKHFTSEASRLIDIKKVELRIVKAIKAAVRTANPGMRARPIVTIKWDVHRPKVGSPFFYGDITIDLNDRRFRRKVEQLLPNNPGIGYYQ